MTTGAVLAGGVSLRFGRLKQFYPVDGEPLIDRVARILAGVADDIVVVASPSLAPYLRDTGYRIIVDDMSLPCSGPLRALATLDASLDEYIYAPVDAAWLTARGARALRNLCRENPRGLSTPVLGGGVMPMLFGCKGRGETPFLDACIETGLWGRPSHGYRASERLLIAGTVHMGVDPLEYETLNNPGLLVEPPRVEPGEGVHKLSPRSLFLDHVRALKRGDPSGAYLAFRREVGEYLGRGLRSLTVHTYKDICLHASHLGLHGMVDCSMARKGRRRIYPGAAGKFTSLF